VLDRSLGVQSGQQTLYCFWFASGYPPNPADDALSSAQASQSTKTFGLLTQADSSL
jgi:hypothetical protein